MKNILLLTDFSKSSLNAIKYSCELLDEENINYYVLYVRKSSKFIMSDLMSSSKSNVHDAVIGNYEEALNNLVVTLNKEYKGNYKAIIDYDDLVASINQAIKLYAIDMVVAGFNGASNLKEVVLGSNTLNIIRKSTIPLLVIPEKVTYKKNENVLLLLDENDALEEVFSSEITHKIIDKNTTVNILRVVNSKLEKTSVIIEKDKHYLKENINHFSTVYNCVKGIPLEMAKSYFMQTNTVDLTILKVEEKRFLDHFYNGKSTVTISQNLQKPMFVLR